VDDKIAPVNTARCGGIPAANAVVLSGAFGCGYVTLNYYLGEYAQQSQIVGSFETFALNLFNH